MLSPNLDSSSAPEVLEVRKRVLKACLAVAIMAQLSERNVLSATNIISLFKKRHKIQLSPGTLYPVLYALERDGKIRRLPNRRKRLYGLTSKGKETIRNIRGNVGELHKMISELLK
jgi:DNA-binding PadR family transcriptional regulator